MRTALLACSAVICCCAVLAWQPGAAHAKNAGLDRVERKVVRLVNRIRAHHGLRRLKASRTLAHAASDHTGDMLRADYLSHDSSDGTPMARASAATPARAGSARTSRSPRAAAASRAASCGCGWPRRATARCCCRRRAAASASGRARGRLGSAAYSVFTVDFASCTLTVGGGGPDSLRRRKMSSTARDYQALMRYRLIESRLTPNAISLTGFALCVVAAVLVWQDYFFLGGARVHRRLGLRHARRPLLADVGQGHAVRRVPGLDARPHRGGHRADRRRLPVLRPRRQPRGRRRRHRRARLADGLLHARPRRGARRRVQGRHRRPRRARRDPVGRAGARQGRRRSSTWNSWSLRCMCWRGSPSSPSCSASGTCAAS